MSRKTILPFFLDQNVPEMVARFLEEAGHKVTRLREVMAVDTADQIIALACSKSGHILVSHDKDFKQIAKRLGITKNEYRTNLHRIAMQCPEPKGAQRLADCLDLIVWEWKRTKKGQQMVIEVRDSSIRIVR